MDIVTHLVHQTIPKIALQFSHEHDKSLVFVTDSDGVEVSVVTHPLALKSPKCHSSIDDAMCLLVGYHALTQVITYVWVAIP